MPISMSPDAHYVTQSSVYSSPLLGPLTDRRIAKYKKQGYYSTGMVEERKASRAKKRRVTVRADLLKMFK